MILFCSALTADNVNYDDMLNYSCQLDKPDTPIFIQWSYVCTSWNQESSDKSNTSNLVKVIIISCNMPQSKYNNNIQDWSSALRNNVTIIYKTSQVH